MPIGYPESAIWSLSSWRAWIEIGVAPMLESMARRRSPHGERGLKLDRAAETPSDMGRSPHGERGLKFIDYVTGVVNASRSPHGERGLKYERVRTKQYPQTCRSPHGERGLK